MILAERARDFGAQGVIQLSLSSGPSRSLHTCSRSSPGEQRSPAQMRRRSTQHQGPPSYSMMPELDIEPAPWPARVSSGGALRPEARSFLSPSEPPARAAGIQSASSSPRRAALQAASVDVQSVHTPGQGAAPARDPDSISVGRSSQGRRSRGARRVECRTLTARSCTDGHNGTGRPIGPA